MVPFKKQIFKWFLNGRIIFKWFFNGFLNGFLNGRLFVPLIVGSRTSKRRHDERDKEPTI